MSIGLLAGGRYAVVYQVNRPSRIPFDSVRKVLSALKSRGNIILFSSETDRRFAPSVVQSEVGHRAAYMPTARTARMRPTAKEVLALPLMRLKVLAYQRDQRSKRRTSTPLRHSCCPEILAAGGPVAIDRTRQVVMSDSSITDPAIAWLLDAVRYEHHLRGQHWQLRTSGPRFPSLSSLSSSGVSLRNRSPLSDAYHLPLTLTSTSFRLSVVEGGAGR
jgi:hypothetical protein